MIEFAQGAINAELAMHASWLKEWDNLEIRDEDMNPTCQLYTSYLISVAYDRPFEEAVVAYLPCFWIYHKVGMALAQSGSPDPTYQRWIDEYASPEFEAGVNQMKSIVDAVCGDQSDQMRWKELAHHFKRTCEMEYMFWDAAYRDVKWPTF
jgi:thiaminase/transcriptional activator TenA